MDIWFYHWHCVVVIDNWCIQTHYYKKVLKESLVYRFKKWHGNNFKPNAVEFGVVPQNLHMRSGTAGVNHSLRDIRAVLLSKADLPDPAAP